MNAASPSIAIAGNPDVLVYPDIQDAARFYGFAAHPRVARDETGAPLMSLMIYGRTSGGRFVASGGQITATFDLAISAAERQAIEQQLHGSVLYPDWIDTQVTVEITEGVTAQGTGSLAGANECVVSAMLTGPQADSLRQALIGKSRAMKVRYQVSIRAAARTAGSSSTNQNYSVGTATRLYSSRVDYSAIQTGPVQLTLEGSVEPGALDLASRIQTISL